MLPSLKSHGGIGIVILSVCFLIASCQGEKEHTAPAIHARDSVAMMVSNGVNTLISDSGIIKYRIVTEQWEVNQNLNPSRWIFRKGLFLEQFDEKFHIQSYIQCDTAYYYDVERLWELRGRVSILTKDGLRFYSEELYWNQNTHELYSYKYSRLITPERQLQGTYFRSDENMTHYTVSNSKGSFVKEDFDRQETTAMPAAGQSADTVQMPPKRQPAVPQRKQETIPLLR